MQARKDINTCSFSTVCLTPDALVSGREEWGKQAQNKRHTNTTTIQAESCVTCSSSVLHVLKSSQVIRCCQYIVFKEPNRKLITCLLKFIWDLRHSSFTYWQLITQRACFRRELPRVGLTTSSSIPISLYSQVIVGRKSPWKHRSKCNSQAAQALVLVRHLH